jgi:hypothetical protein
VVGGGGDVGEDAIGRGGETEHEPLDWDKQQALGRGGLLPIAASLAFGTVALSVDGFFSTECTNS